MTCCHTRVPHTLYTGIGVSPSSRALARLHDRSKSAEKGKHAIDEDTTSTAAQGAVPILAGLPSVPKKLARRILDGEFINMAELLRTTTATLARARNPSGVKWRTSWSGCNASTHTWQSWSQRILTGFRTFRITGPNHRGPDGVRWQWVAGVRLPFSPESRSRPKLCLGLPGPNSLDYIAFAGQAKSSQCKWCFALTHKGNECDLAPPAKTPTTPPLPPSMLLHRPGCSLSQGRRSATHGITGQILCALTRHANTCRYVCTVAVIPTSPGRKRSTKPCIALATAAQATPSTAALRF